MELSGEQKNAAFSQAALRQSLRRVGARIRELRYARGWKQEDLAAHIEGSLTRSAISYLENGKKVASLKTIFEIAAAFEVDAASLLLDPQSHERHSAAAAILQRPPKDTGGSRYLNMSSVARDLRSLAAKPDSLEACFFEPIAVSTAHEQARRSRKLGE